MSKIHRPDLQWRVLPKQFITRLLLIFPLIYSTDLFSKSENHGSAADFNPGEINILPPSPTAAALGQYGLNPVSLSTGTPNINVPLHQISYRGINVPISLSYSSNGIKVNEIASWVGLGWSLNAGGVITRVIKDEADEERNALPMPDVIDINDPKTVQYIMDNQDEGRDTELDLYMFNFNGYSGKFVINEHGAPIIMPAQKLEIEYTHADQALGFMAFYITTPDGVKYEFSDHEISSTMNIGCKKDFNQPRTSAWYLSKIIHPNGAEITFNYIADNIEHLASLDQTFQELFQDVPGCDGSDGTTCGPAFSNSTCVRQSRVVGKKLSAIIFGTDSVSFQTSIRNDVINGKKLDTFSAYVRGNQVKKWTLTLEDVNATQHSNLHGNSHTQKRMFLTKLTEWNNANSESKEYQFEYIDKENMPARLSFAQDHWGYYNGANNSDFVPDMPGNVFVGIGGDREPNSEYAKKGLLSQITYPTGGFSQFDYEPHSYFKRNFSEDVYDNYFLEHYTDDEVRTYTKRDTLIISQNSEPQTMIFSASVRQSHEGFEFVNCQATVTIKRLGANSGTSKTFTFEALDEGGYATFNEPGDPDSYYYLTKGAYVIEISVREFVQASINIQQYKIGSYSYPKNIEVGGMRIKKETVFNGHDAPQVKSYYYAPYENLESTSLSIPKTPTYYKILYTEYGGYCAGGEGSAGAINFGECGNEFLYSSSQNNLYPLGGSHVYYSKVLVSDGENFENGFVEHDFMVNPDVNPKVILGEDIMSATYSNTGWNNGLETKVTYRDPLGNVLYVEENEYVLDSASTTSTTGVVIQKKTTDFIVEQAIYNCTESNTGTDKMEQLCNAYYLCEPTNQNHEHRYGRRFIGTNQNWIQTKNCRAPGSNMVIRYGNCHPCMFKNPGETATYSKAFDHLNVVEYKNYSYRHYLGSTKKTTYNKDGTIMENYTRYRYDDPDHMQLTSLERITSREDTLKTFYYYPSDYTLDDMYYLDTVQFMPALPVRVDQFRASQQTSSTIVKYDNLGQPLEVYRKNDFGSNTNHQSNELLPSSGYELQTTLQYDDKIHVVRGRQPKTGVEEAYLWNDEGTLVLAHAIQSDTARFYYTSFEDESAANTKIGEGAHSGNFSFSSHGFTPSNTSGLKMSYWKYENSTWTFSGEMNYSSTITATGLIDEVRVYPKGAMVTTYYYDDHDRLTHVTDPKNLTTTYSYDDFGRLSHVKDHKGHVLSAQEYHYKTPIANQ